MKAGIVAFYMAFKALKTLGYEPASEIYFETVVEEECTGNGALYTLLQGYKADGVIIPEPFPFLVSEQLGVMWLSIEVKGSPAHVLNTSAGSNAIEAAYFLYDSLRDLEKSYNLPENRRPAYNDFNHPVNFNLGKISGGNWASSVPSKAVIEIRVGFFSHQNISQVKTDIENTLHEASKKIPSLQSYKVIYEGFQAEGCAFDTSSPFVKTFQSVYESLLSKPLQTKPITCTTDARFFQLYHNIPSIIYGPEASHIHGIDESVSLKSVFEVCKILALFIVEWCGIVRHS